MRVTTRRWGGDRQGDWGWIDALLEERVAIGSQDTVGCRVDGLELVDRSASYDDIHRGWACRLDCQAGDAGVGRSDRSLSESPHGVDQRFCQAKEVLGAREFARVNDWSVGQGESPNENRR